MREGYGDLQDRKYWKREFERAGNKEKSENVKFCDLFRL